MSVRNCQEMLKVWVCSTYKFWPFWLNYVPTFSISQELFSGFFCILLFPWVCGSSQVAHGLCEVPSMKVLTRGMMKEHLWGSIHDLSQLLAFYTLLRWPQTPCHQAHTCPCACHVLLSFDLGRCVDPVRFSLIARSPMVQILLCSNCGVAHLRAEVFLQSKLCFRASQLRMKKGSLRFLQFEQRQHRTRKPHLSIS